MRRVVLVAALGALSSGAVLALPGQDASHPFTDSLFADLARAKTTAQLPPISRCAGRQGSLSRLCEGLIDIRRSELDSLRDPALAGEALLRRTVEEEPKWAVGWYGLGIARLQLERFTVIAKDGPLQPLGVSLVAGAGNALVHALELDSTLIGAAEALALAPFPREGPSRMGERIAMLRRVRTSLPLSPAARLNIARAARESGMDDTARVLLNEALAHGADSGIVYLELARALYKATRPIEGHEALIHGASLASSPVAQKWYREQLAWVASPEELAQWDSLPRAERGTWLDAFWSTRDVKEGRAAGDRLIEHYKRVEYAMAAFYVVIPQMGRQKLVSVMGADDRTNNAARSDFTTEGVEQQAGDTPGAPGIPRNGDYAGTLGANVPFRQFSVQDAILDDRGYVWIRHGKPDVELHTTGGYAASAWMYRRPNEPPLVLFFKEVEFQGTSAASMLIATPAGTDGVMMQQLCGQLNGMCDALQPGSTVGLGSGHLGLGQGQNQADQTYCVSRADASGKGKVMDCPVDYSMTGAGLAGNGTRGVMANGAVLTPEVIARERDRGVANIARATTSDDLHPEFTTPLDPVVQMYGLNRTNEVAPRLVLAFAIPGDKLVSQRATPDGRPVYDVRVRLMSATRADGKRFELDTIRQFVTAKPLLEGQFLTGLAELPLPEGVYATSVTLSQSDGRGTVNALMSVTVPGRAGAVRISDLVLGRTGSGVKWNSGTAQVPLNPLNAYDKGGAAELYYQVSGVPSGQSYETKAEFFLKGEENKPPKLKLGFTDKAGDGVIEATRTLGLQHLEPGTYRLKVTVQSGGKESSAAAWLVIAKPK